MDNKEFYDKEFVGSRFGTSVSRGEMESLPVPFYMKDVDDETMEMLIENTEADVMNMLDLYDDDEFSFNDDEQSEAWWEALESNANELGIPYYEDIEEE